MKYARLDMLDCAGVRKFRVDVKKRLTLLSYDSVKKREDGLRAKTRPFPLLFVDNELIQTIEENASGIIDSKGIGVSRKGNADQPIHGVHPRV